MTIALIAFALYLLATALLTRAVLRDGNQAPARWLAPALAAVALHAGYHVLVAMRTAGG
ncbi:inner membrane protein YpjD, partial [Xanthomonas oryzae pv. oryzae]